MTSALRWAAKRAILMFHKVTRQCPQTTAFEAKGQPKHIRTEVPLLTSLTPYRLAKPATRNVPLDQCPLTLKEDPPVICQMPIAVYRRACIHSALAEDDACIESRAGENV